MNNLYHVIKDPVHDSMQFTSTEDAWIKPFIDSPPFQRLRHIKQMGMGDFIFPGAVHTRFNHSIGCCYVASQIAHKIGLDDEDRQLVMLACLLHDIGHGPFSHTFEGIFTSKKIRHEVWTPSFLADYGTDEFFDYYNRANPDYKLTQEKFTMIADMIMHRSNSKSVLADIVSSQLDADRLDYLLRDSHFCGVGYGQFDVRWMIHCMTIVQTKQGARLGITHKGIGVVEHYLMARRLMVRNIYQTQKKLAFEFFLVHLLANLSENLAHDGIFSEIRATRLGQFLFAADQFNKAVKTTKDVEKLQREFLQKNYANYKELRDYDVFALIKQLAEMPHDTPAKQMAIRLDHRIMPKIFRLDHMNLEKTTAEVQEFKDKHKNDIQDWQLSIIKTPHQSYSNEEDPILVVNPQGIVKPIGNISMMINAISDKLEHVALLSIDKAIADDKRIIALTKQLQAAEPVWE